MSWGQLDELKVEVHGVRGMLITPPTSTCVLLLSVLMILSQPFLFLIHLLFVLPPTPTLMENTFGCTTKASLPNLMTLQGLPHLAILLALSQPLINVSITISTPTYAEFHPTATLESLPPPVFHLCFMFKSVSKHTEEKTLCSTFIVCHTIK
ncbi:hypothetical protein EDD18DRAFT_1365239 [Armillaria luteobubalina]|uniref:Uncharacterized protein n=1 Tax=Armillaria luteobubalina TaxID=153913 RepID=A0AA39P542_9AGAR|nr:hypothetical protein EDD18DRAFT_1365239 [Armillaria luteobubalina]